MPIPYMLTTASRLWVLDDCTICYRLIGSGMSSLLAFHGFGQDSRAYEPLAHWQDGQFTIVALDLFFHGGSTYSGDQLLTKPRWHRLLTAFLQAHHIHRFSVLGFSLGGRFALVTAELFAERLDHLYLLAPDGITQSAWYRLATRSSAGRWLFRYTLRHISLLSELGHILTRLGLLNRSVMRFTELSLGTVQQRDLVYQSWLQFRLLQPDLVILSQLLTSYSVNVYLAIGVFDRIVPGLWALPLMKRLNRYTLITLKMGHNRLIETLALWKTS